jgi:hypothetical protein
MLETTVADLNKPLITEPARGGVSTSLLVSLGSAGRVLSKFNSQPLVDDCANTACNLKEGC